MKRPVRLVLTGVMPAFEGILDEEQALTVIAYFQSFWPDNIYERWQTVDSR